LNQQKCGIELTLASSQNLDELPVVLRQVRCNSAERADDFLERAKAPARTADHGRKLGCKLSRERRGCAGHRRDGEPEDAEQEIVRGLFVRL
jgi:hypothetical protein